LKYDKLLFSLKSSGYNYGVQLSSRNVDYLKRNANTIKYNKAANMNNQLHHYTQQPDDNRRSHSGSLVGWFWIKNVLVY